MPVESPLSQPSLRDLLALEIPSEVRISPNGSKAAILVRTTDWKNDRFETICYVQDLAQAGSALRRLNRSGSAWQAEWIDDETLALLKTSGSNDRQAQVWLYEGLVGEGWQVTDHKDSVGSFKPYAGGLLYLADDPERAEKKKRADQFGSYQHFEQEDSSSALFYTGFAELRLYEKLQRAATEDEAKDLVKPVVDLARLLPKPLHISEMVPAPDAKSIYLDCRKRADFVYWQETSVFCLQLDAPAALAEFLRREQEKKKKVESEKAKVSTAGAVSQAENFPVVTGSEEPAETGSQAEESQPDTSEKEEEEEEDLSYLGTLTFLNLPALCSIIDVSPDSDLLLLSYQGRDTHFYTQGDLWLMDVATALSLPDVESARAAMSCLTAGFDREIMQVYWVASGIFCSYVDGTVMRVALFDEDGEFTPLDFDGFYLFDSFHIGAAGRLGLVTASSTAFPEACVATPGDGAHWTLQRLTKFSIQVEDWDFGTVETIRWKSVDGVEIEGALRKPTNFDPSKKYPLVFVVHGGPTWFSSEYLVTGEDLRYYPSIQFIQQDVLVLKPNYRGSTGRGQAFLELNVKNLGVGDLWDLESAITHLDSLGWIDPQRVGCMGWSQGGYISAFAGLRSDKFTAVSVGAGISDWYTYHISNDIPHFTTEYLSGSPFRDRSLYEKTAPISGLAQAKTPVLIQHGSDDQRVPLSNAKELYRGLKEMGVPVELFIFPGMGHPITRPRENHAVMHQNLSWFGHYLLGQELKLEI
jgi:dipeptidyl aminopeptidase/acylaminoacyl peptidase